MKKIEIEIPDGKRAEWVNDVLTLVDDTPKDVMQCIKTFEDACVELGYEHPFVKSYEKYVNIAREEEADVIAYLKLRIITTALNEGWEPQFVEGERRWYALFSLMNNNANANGGLVCAGAGYAASKSGSLHGVRLAFRTEELSEYAGKQFTDIYKDYCFRQIITS